MARMRVSGLLISHASTRLCLWMDKENQDFRYKILQPNLSIPCEDKEFELNLITHWLRWIRFFTPKYFKVIRTDDKLKIIKIRETDFK